MKYYYYFCQACGGDTAAFEPQMVCPYCHAHSPKFGLVGESEGFTNTDDLATHVQALRQRWESENPGKERGAPQWKGRRLFRRKTRTTSSGKH